MKHLPIRECGWAALVLVVLAGLYVGGYYANVVRVELLLGSRSGHSVVNVRVYRVGGTWAEAFFAPMHAIDRQIRPAYWGRCPLIRCGALGGSLELLERFARVSPARSPAVVSSRRSAQCRRRGSLTGTTRRLGRQVIDCPGVRKVGSGDTGGKAMADEPNKIDHNPQRPRKTFSKWGVFAGISMIPITILNEMDGKRTSAIVAASAGIGCIVWELGRYLFDRHRDCAFEKKVREIKASENRISN